MNGRDRLCLRISVRGDLTCESEIDPDVLGAGATSTLFTCRMSPHT